MKRPVILVVDDDPDDREIYGKLLWYNGFDLLYAESGETALRLARSHLPDLILLDLVLPDATGLDVCSSVKGHPHTRDIPVVMLTGRTEAETGGPARAAGCERFLQKPLAPIDVLHTVEELIGRAPLPTPEADEEASDGAELAPALPGQPRAEAAPRAEPEMSSWPRRRRARKPALASRGGGRDAS